MSKESYRRGAHTVTDFKYHFVWKTKYSYGILKGEIGLRLRDIIREICAENSLDIIKGNVRSMPIRMSHTAQEGSGLRWDPRSAGPSSLRFTG